MVLANPTHTCLCPHAAAQKQVKIARAPLFGAPLSFSAMKQIPRNQPVLLSFNYR